MKLTLITFKFLNLKEENISDVTDDLIEDYALKTDLKNNLEDLLFSLWKWAAEVSKTDSECLTAKRAWIKGKAHYKSISLRVYSLKDNVFYHKDKL